MLSGVVFNWLGLGVNVLISFLLAPLLIHGLGDFYYGMWALAGSVMDYYGLLDFGMRSAFVRFVARFNGADQRAALDRTLATSLTAMGVIGAFVGLLSIPLAFGLPGFFSLHGESRQTFVKLFLLLGLSAGINFPSRILGSYLCGIRCFGFYNVSAIASAVVRGAGLLAVLRFGYGVIGVGLATLLVTVFSFVLQAYLLRRADPEASFDVRKASWRHLRELVSFSVYAFIDSSGESLRSYTSSFIVARMLGIAMVTPYSIASRLMEYFKWVMNSLGAPILSSMAEMDGAGRREQFRALFLRSTKFSMLTGLFVGALVWIDGRALIDLWVGPKLRMAFPALVVLTASYVIILGQQPTMMAALAKARHRPLALLTLLEGLANIAISVWLAPSYGILGVAIGALVPVVVTKTVIQPVYAARLSGVSMKDYALKGLAGPLTAFAAFLAIASVAPVTGPGAIRFLVAICWQSILFGALAYAVCLDPSERRRMNVAPRRLAAVLGFVEA